MKGKGKKKDLGPYVQVIEVLNLEVDEQCAKDKLLQ